MGGISEYDDEHVAVEDAECIRETDDALLVAVDGEEYWVPLKCLHKESEVFGDGHEGTLIVQKWLARDRGLWEG